MKKTKIQTFLILSKALLTCMKKTPLFVAVLLVILAGATSSYIVSSPATEEQTLSRIDSTMVTPTEDLKKYLRDRPFIDSFPVDPRKTYKIYIFGKDDMGIFITAKNFRQVIEVFTYKVSDNVISFNFLNANIKGKSPFRILPCRGPGSFDISLELDKDIKSNNRKGIYYSSKKIKAPSVMGGALQKMFDLE